MSQSHKSNDSSASQSKKDQQSRRWMLTLSLEHYSQADIEARLGKYQAVIGQLEEGGKTGYRHWNLYVEHKSAIRFSALKRAFPKAHIDKAKKTRSQCVKYVTKADTYAGVRISLGKLDLTVKAGKRTDLESYLEQIMLEGKTPGEVMLEDIRSTRYYQYLDRLQLEKDRATWGSTFRDIEVHYISGASRTGKTSAIYETYGYSNCCRVSTYDHPFDHYRGEDVLILDEYRGGIQIGELLSYLEGYPVELEARNVNKMAKFTKVFVVSNEPFKSLYPNVQADKPATWEALQNRFTSISRMTLDVDDDGNPSVATLHVEGGTPPKLHHLLTQKPVEIVEAVEEEAAPRGADLDFDELEAIFDDPESALFD